jgi:hypothetical protein
MSITIRRQVGCKNNQSEQQVIKNPKSHITANASNPHEDQKPKDLMRSAQIESVDTIEMVNRGKLTLMS